MGLPIITSALRSPHSRRGGVTQNENKERKRGCVILYVTRGGRRGGGPKIPKKYRHHIWKPPWVPFVTEQERVKRSERARTAMRLPSSGIFYGSWSLSRKSHLIVQQHEATLFVCMTPTIQIYKIGHSCCSVAFPLFLKRDGASA